MAVAEIFLKSIKIEKCCVLQLKDISEYGKYNKIVSKCVFKIIYLRGRNGEKTSFFFFSLPPKPGQFQHAPCMWVVGIQSVEHVVSLGTRYLKLHAGQEPNIKCSHSDIDVVFPNVLHMPVNIKSLFLLIHKDFFPKNLF